MRVMTPSQILSEAADEIERVGWCQHVGATPDGRICAHHALNVVTDGPPPCTPEAQQLSNNWRRAVYMLEDHLDGMLITEWNDKREQTKENIVATLRKVAAEKQERQESHASEH